MAMVFGSWIFSPSNLPPMTGYFLSARASARMTKASTVISISTFLFNSAWLAISSVASVLTFR